MARKCGGGEGQRTGGFHVAQRVGMIAGSAEIQDFGHMVECFQGFFFCSFVHCCCIWYCVPSLFSNWTNIYLRHAICQCHGDTSREEDKYGPHYVAVMDECGTRKQTMNYTKSWVLGVLRLSCVSCVSLPTSCIFPHILLAEFSFWKMCALSCGQVLIFLLESVHQNLI